MGFHDAKQPANQHAQHPRDDKPTAVAQLVDNRASTAAQLKLQTLMRSGLKTNAQERTRSSMVLSQRDPIQRVAYFSDNVNPSPALAAPPQEAVIWVSPLLGTNHAMYNTGADAEQAVTGNLGVVGAPTHTSVSNSDPASAGSYSYWYDNANSLLGMPEHTSDPTNRLYRVTAQSVSSHAPVVHKHAAEYPGIDQGNAWTTMSNPNALYNQHAGAMDHYLHRPAQTDGVKFKTKLQLTSSNTKHQASVKGELENIARTGNRITA